MEKILEQINSPEDVKKLNIKEKEQLAKEIREYIIKIVSENGGHLASNLGIVELTIALHSVFNVPEDKIVWDVGHQTYVHKIITGRKESLNTLRKLNGINLQKVKWIALEQDIVEHQFQQHLVWHEQEI